MKRITVLLISISLSAILFVYVFSNSQSFPNPPSDSVQSKEPADTENPLRRAYFTNLNRQEVINHYKKEFNSFSFIFYTPRLNYPPEESATIIRDQTRSTYLEEIVHPLRESLYINGFEPKSEKDTIIIEGKRWNQKIIVRYVPSSFTTRLVVTLLFGISFYLVLNEALNLIYFKKK